jgi:hypothetical protein
MAERFQQPRRGGHRRPALRVVQVPLGRRPVNDADPQLPRVGAALLDQRAGQRRRVVRVARHGIADHVEHAGRVPDGPGDGSVDGAARPALPDQRPLAHPATGRFEPDQAAFAGRDADGPAAVVGMSYRHHPRCDRGSRSARGPAGRVAGVPGIARRPAAQRLGGHRGAHLGGVGAAERDEAGRPELGRQVRRHRPPHVAQRADAERGRLAVRHAAEVLEQGRHPAERAVGQLAIRFLAGRVEPGPDDRVQFRVDGLDPGDGRLGQLLGAHFAAPYQLCLCGGVQPGRLAHMITLHVLRRGEQFAVCCVTGPCRLVPVSG